MVTLPAPAQTIEDSETWDALVLHLGGRLLQSWRWGEFKGRHGWKPYRIIVRIGGATGLAQILVRRAYGLSVLYIPRGPLADAVSPELAVAFREAVDRLAHATRAIIVLAEPEDERGLALLPEHLGWRPSPFVIQPRRTLRVPLGDDDQLLNQMKPKTRYNVRLAFRRGVTTRQASLAELPTFYELLRETAERDGFGIHRIDYFSDLLRACNEDAALLFAEFEGQPAAAALVVRFGEEAVYLYGASRTELQRHMPAYAVQWAAMQWARARGCRWYDLWGIPESNELPPDTDENHLNVRIGLWGVYRFKLGFGGHPYTYPGTRELVRQPLLVWLWRRLRPLGA